MKTVLLCLLALPLVAQNPSNQDLDVRGHFNMSTGTYSAPFIPVGSDPTGACTPAGAVVMNNASGQLTGCIALIWTPLGGAGSGNVSGPGSSTNFALAAWNGTSGLVLRNTSVITDGSGNLTANSLTSSGGGAGTLELTQGTAQGSFPANSVSLYAPATIATAYRWKLPAADAAGALVSDGAGTPGTLSIVGFTGSGSIVRATSPTISNLTVTGSCTGCSTTPTGFTDFPDKRYVPAANCNNATAGNGWSLPTSSAPTLACHTGSNVQDGYLSFADAQTAQFSYLLPDDWDSTASLDARIFFTDSSTSGTVIWQAATSCTTIAGGETDDQAFNTAQAFGTITLGATASAGWIATLTGMTKTGCAAGDLLHVKITRTTDTASGDANASGVQITARRSF